MSTYRTCPECGTQPITRRGMTLSTRHLVFATCTKGFDCDLYPYTKGHATASEALASWDRGEAFPDEQTTADT